jgi:hypothetical protein
MGQSQIANAGPPPPPPQPLPARLVVGRDPSLREPLLRDGLLFWLEQRPQEGGRTTLLVRPAAQAEAEPL